LYLFFYRRAIGLCIRGTVPQIVQPLDAFELRVLGLGIHIRIGKVSKRTVGKNLAGFSLHKCGHEGGEVQHRIGVRPALAFYQRLGRTGGHHFFWEFLGHLHIKFFVGCCHFVSPFLMGCWLAGSLFYRPRRRSRTRPYIEPLSEHRLIEHEYEEEEEYEYR